MTEVIWSVRGDAEAVADLIGSVLAKPGRRAIAVPGGRTPLPIFKILERRSICWGLTDVWLTDDRIVPHNHSASNFGLLSRSFDATAARLHPLVEGVTPPPFDLVWVGMGEDGHVASIFPGSEIDPAEPARVMRDRPDPLPPEAPYERLTLTLNALVATKDLILVVRGATKRRLIEAAAAGENDLPIAQLIKAARSPIKIFWSSE